MAENRARGLNAVTSDIQGQGRVAVPDAVFTTPDSGSGRIFDVAAQSFSQIGGRIGQLADQAAAVEGQDAGRIAGLDPEFRATKSLTIRGQAFDKAGLDVALTKAKVEMGADLQAAFDKHQNDPAKLAETLAAKRKVWVDGKLAANNPALLPDLTVAFENAQLGYMRQAGRLHMQRVTAEAKAAFDDELTNTYRTVQQQAAALGLDAAADEAIVASKAAFARTLRRTGPDGAPMVAPGERVKLIQDFDEKVTTARLLGAFDRLPSLDAKRKFIDDLEADWSGKGDSFVGSGLAKVYDLDGIRRVKGLLEGELRSDKALQTAAMAGLEHTVKSIARQAENGIDIKPDEMAAIEGRVAAVAGQKPELALDLANAKDTLSYYRDIKTMNGAQLAAEERGIQGRLAAEGGDAKGREFRRLQVLQGFVGKQQTALKDDALNWSDKTGYLKVTALDFTSPEAAHRSLTARIGEAEAIAQHFSIVPQYLKPLERQALVTMASNGGQGALLAWGMIASAGDKGETILREVGDHGPAVALVGKNVLKLGVDDPVSKEVAAAFAILRTPDFKSMAPPEAKYRQLVVDTVGSAIDPVTQTGAVRVANALYDLRAQAQRITNFDNKLWIKGFREALGERKVGNDIYGGIVDQGWWGDKKIVIPPSVKQSGWGDLISAIQPEDLAKAGHALPLGKGGEPIPLSRIKAGTLVQAGDGTYAVALGKPGVAGQEDFASDPKRPDKVWRLDLNRLLPLIRERRPDLVLGGR